MRFVGCGLVRGGGWGATAARKVGKADLSRCFQRFEAPKIHLIDIAQAPSPLNHYVYGILSSTICVLKPLRKMTPLVNGTPHSNTPPKSSVFPLKTYANAISLAADVITEYCTSNDLPQPSFRPDAPRITIPLTAPLAIQNARQTLIDSATRIKQVITEPADYLPRLAVHVRSIGSFTPFS